MNSILSAMVAPLGRWVPAQIPARMCRLIPRACNWSSRSTRSSFHRAGDPVGFVDHEGVAGLEQIHRGHQLGTLAAGAGCLDDDFAAVGGGERVELGLVVLDPGGDAGVPDADGVVLDVGDDHGSDRLENDPERVDAARRFGTSFGTGFRWFGVLPSERPENDRFRDGAPETSRMKSSPNRTKPGRVGRPTCGDRPGTHWFGEGCGASAARIQVPTAAGGDCQQGLQNRCPGQDGLTVPMPQGDQCCPTSDRRSLLHPQL